MFFEYQGSYDYQKRTSVVTREQADHIADLFESEGIDSPFASEWNGPKDANGRPEMTYLSRPAITSAVQGFDSMWTCDVHHVLSERRKAKHFEEIRAAQGAVANAAIRAYLLALDPVHYLRAPEVRDLSDLAQLAMRGNLGNGKPVYQPEPGCKARLKLKEAVSFWYEQASYADHSRYAVPVELAPDADMTVCRRNLGRFMASLRTHNGYAGSGCTWSAELITTEAGAFVVMDCRASISD